MPAIRAVRRVATLCSTLVTVLVVVPAHAQDGLTLTFRMSMTGTGPMAGMVPGMSGPREIRIVAAGGRSRVEYGTTPATPPFPPGAIMLQDKGRMIVVDTARHEYFAFDPNAMLREVSAMQQSTGTAMRAANPEVKVEHVGAGDPVLGTPTDHWRVTTRYEMLMSMAGSEMRVRTEMRQDSYYGDIPGLPATRDLGPLAPGAASPATSGMASILGPELATRMLAAFDSLPKRMALRTVQTTTTYNGDTPMMAMTNTTEVTAVTRGPIAAASFDVPAGYREVPMPSIARRAP